MRAARFPAYRDLSGFDFSESAADEALLNSLHRCDFIADAHNIVMIGGPGTGKTQVSIAPRRLRQLQSHIKELDRRCAALYRAVHPSNAIQSIRGIGAALAPVLVGSIANVHRFTNERQMRGFCGMFPVSSSSGSRERPRQRITQTGNDRVKRALYLAADVARRIDPDLAAVYWRLMVNKGHHHKQALCAVATRLVNRIHRVLKTGVPHQLRDRDGRPIDVQQGKAIVAAHFTVPEVTRCSRRVHSP